MGVVWWFLFWVEGEGGVVGGVSGKSEACVVLMFWRLRSESSSRSVSVVLFWGVGERMVSRDSFGMRPVCQVAFAHQPIKSSLMLSKIGLRLRKSRVQ